MPSSREKSGPKRISSAKLSLPLLYVAVSLSLATFFDWPRRWLVSGSPILQFTLILGAANKYRILPFISLWTLITTINFVYSIAATSWLLYWGFAIACYPAILLTCLVQFSVVGHYARRSLRKFLKQIQFIDDKIAFFGLPALEIDTEVDGLMVIRGITISLSTLSIVAHGVEVGIKLSDDMELAIQTERVTVSLFRRIEVGDCFANLKGGHYEMTFGELAQRTKDIDGDAVMVSDTPLLQAASRDGESRKASRAASMRSMEIPAKEKMRSVMTDGAGPEDASAEDGLESAEKISLTTEEALQHYKATLQELEDTSAIRECRAYVKDRIDEGDAVKRKFDETDLNEMRAAICSELHQKASVPHPPPKSVKVTTLQSLTHPRVRAVMHRLPMLYRLLLNPLSYFHPIRISSITVTSSGQWIKHMLAEKIFEHYGERDTDIRNLESRISAWLSEANFAIELANITGLAQVPILTSYDIICQLSFGDVMAYRALPKDVDLSQVIRLGGGDALFKIPSFLLPHHEHLLPRVPTCEDKKELEQDIETANGKPKTIQAEHELQQAEKDEANIKMAIHARLPACFDQELLDFISALVKASKVVEMEKEPNAMEEEVHGIKEFSKALNRSMKDGMKKAVVGGIVNDRWIAKMVGKITKKLEQAQGDVGYSGDIPVALGHYRPKTEEEKKEKLLP